MTPPIDPAETELIERFRRGDPDAFAALFEPLVAALRAHVGRQLPARFARRLSTADLLQDVRLVTFQRCADFVGETRDDFRKWLFGIANMRLRKTWQHHGGTDKRNLGSEVSRDDRAATADLAGGQASPSQAAIGREVQDLAQRAMQSLLPDHREVLRLVRFEGLELKEAAARMGRSYDALYKLHGRALYQFTEAFERLRGASHD